MWRTALILALLAAPAGAEPKLTPWSGPAHRVGEGGTVETHDGIDIWTSGTPPRGYTILGVTTRHGDVGRIRAKSYAKLVRKLGGDAGIVSVVGQQPRAVYAVTPGIGVVRSIATFQVMVVKYD